MNKATWLLLPLLVCLALSALASGSPELEALETLRHGFAASSDFTADITQEKRLSLMKHTLVSRGMVRFKKPDLFFMELYPPHASRLLLKDNVMTMRLSGQGTIDRFVLPPDQSLTKWFAYLGKPLSATPEGMDLKAEQRRKLWTLQISPRGTGSVQKLTLNFDQEGKVSRVVIEERNHDMTTLKFSRIRRNVGLKDDDFQVE